MGVSSKTHYFGMAGAVESHEDRETRDHYQLGKVRRERKEEGGGRRLHMYIMLLMYLFSLPHSLPPTLRSRQKRDALRQPFFCSWW